MAKWQLLFRFRPRTATFGRWYIGYPFITAPPIVLNSTEQTLPVKSASPCFPGNGRNCYAFLRSSYFSNQTLLYPIHTVLLSMAKHHDQQRSISNPAPQRELELPSINGDSHSDPKEDRYSIGCSEPNAKQTPQLAFSRDTQPSPDSMPGQPAAESSQAFVSDHLLAGGVNENAMKDPFAKQPTERIASRTRTSTGNGLTKLYQRSATLFRPVLSRCQSCLIDTWWPETIGLVFSISCVIAIAGLLLPYSLNRRQVPEFLDGLTLNTLLSILAATSKSSLIFSVTATMGQGKWCWFRISKVQSRRRLMDVQTLDDASRGPLGSVKLLFRQTFVSLCAMGAVVVILSLGYEPFLQQLVSYPVELAQISDEAQTKRAAAIIGDDYYTRIMSGLYGEHLYARTPLCPSGNCTWPLFHSAGWCGKCDTLPWSFESSDCNHSWSEYAKNGDGFTKNCTFSLPTGSVPAGSTIPVNVEFVVYGDDASPVTGLILTYPAWWSLTPTNDVSVSRSTFTVVLSSLATKTPYTPTRTSTHP